MLRRLGGLELTAILCFAAATACAREPADPSPAVPPAVEPPGLSLAGGLAPGDHAVGFRKERLELAWAAADAPSALDLYLWFPARPPGADGVGPLAFADYYRAQEETEPTPTELRDWLLEDMTSPPGVGAADLDAVLAAPMWAHSDAEIASGAHPLVLWSYRGSVPTMQAVLNEYLASHGYVVAFGWPVDRAPPLPWEGDLTQADKKRALDIQIELLEEALDALLPRSWVAGDRAAVAAWS